MVFREICSNSFYYTRCGELELLAMECTPLSLHLQHAVFTKFDLQRLIKPIKLFLLAKRIKQNLWNSKRRIQTAFAKVNWARSMRGQANEAWALYKIKSTLGSLGSLGISLRPNFDSLGTTVIPRRNANNGYVKFVWGVGGNKETSARRQLLSMSE